MNVKLVTMIATTAVLGACSTQPLLPFQEPEAGTPTAKLRVITNSNVRGGAYASCVGSVGAMASAGRFSKGRMSINHTQFPAAPAHLDMAPRFAPKMLGYHGVTRLAEGAYEEVATEYHVPTNVPFLLETQGLSAGGYQSNYNKCPAARQVYQFEPGKSYEAYIGLVAKTSDQGQQMLCAFSVYELLTQKGLGFSVPLRMEGGSASSAPCR